MGGEQADSFGTRLKRLREAAGLTQEELAERAAVTAEG
jgi:transcriptional regulator with XRE-family HTH domain